MAVDSLSARIRWSLDSDELLDYTAGQLAFFGGPKRATVRRALSGPFRETRARVEACFVQIRRKYYFDGERATFNHLHGDHYAIYLYFLANTIFSSGGDEELASRVFLLNKALHGCDIFYGITLPEVFLLIHPVGTVLGNAKYGNYFVAYQNCSIGSLEDGKYPVLAGETVLFARSAVLGACEVGRNVVFGANSFLLNQNVPPNSTVVGQFPSHRVLNLETSVIDRMFR